jgi:hypothetical protein
MLIEAGCDLGARDAHGEDARHYATQQPYSLCSDLIAAELARRESSEIAGAVVGLARASGRMSL